MLRGNTSHLRAPQLLIDLSVLTQYWRGRLDARTLEATWRAVLLRI
jgi:hypothetical protein